MLTLQTSTRYNLLNLLQKSHGACYTKNSNSASLLLTSTTSETKMSHKCQFSLFGHARETCVHCGAENPTVTLWRQLVVHAIENQLPTPTHPYLRQHKVLSVKQLMTMREFKKAMRRASF